MNNEPEHQHTHTHTHTHMYCTMPFLWWWWWWWLSMSIPHHHHQSINMFCLSISQHSNKQTNTDTHIKDTRYVWDWHPAYMSYHSTEHQNMQIYFLPIKQKKMLKKILISPKQKKNIILYMPVFIDNSTIHNSSF